MNQPEYILEESERIHLMENLQDNSDQDWSGVVVELQQSLKALTLAQDLLNGITSSLLVSVQSLLEAQCRSTRQELS